MDNLLYRKLNNRIVYRLPASLFTVYRKTVSGKRLAVNATGSARAKRVPIWHNQVRDEFRVPCTVDG